MKKDQIQALRAKNTEELHVLVGGNKEKLAALRFDLRSGKTANIKEIHSLKKEIAVALSLINEHGKTN